MGKYRLILMLINARAQPIGVHCQLGNLSHNALDSLHTLEDGVEWGTTAAPTNLPY